MRSRGGIRGAFDKLKKATEDLKKTLIITAIMLSFLFGFIVGLTVGYFGSP